MTIKFKKIHPFAVTPTQANPGDAGFDLVAATCITIEEDSVLHETLVYDTGIAVEIPDGYVGLVFPRSSIVRTGLTLSNSVGVIDSGYRGSIQFKFNRHLTRRGVSPYSVGDRIGQLVIIPIPAITFEEVDELSDSVRGTGGFGSSGK